MSQSAATSPVCSPAVHDATLEMVVHRNLASAAAAAAVMAVRK